MSGLHEEEQERLIKKAIINELRNMIMDDEYNKISDELSRSVGYKEIRVYKKDVLGLGLINFIWKVHVSGGVDFLDDQVSPFIS